MGACLLMFSLSVGLAVGGVALTGAKWRTLPEWWAAASTTLAFVMAAIAAWSTWQALSMERARDVERLEIERRKQARLVAAWCPRLTLDVTTDLRVVPRNGVAVLRAINRSGLPVTNVRYAFELKVFTEDGKQGFFGPVIERSILEPLDGPTDILLTTAEWDKVAELVIHADGVDLMSDEGWVLTAGISFTDAAGQHWVREQNGRLLRAPEMLVAMRAKADI